MSAVTNEKALEEWLARLDVLIGLVERCARADDWSTRRIEKRMKESRIGAYVAPALLMQHESTRLYLEPIASDAVDAEGVVDFYEMPQYDDVARLVCSNGEWRVLDLPASPAWRRNGSPSGGSDDSVALTEDVVQSLLAGMKEHAASS